MKSICPLILLATAVLAQNAPSPLKPGLYATFDTSKGTIVAVLYEKVTPASVKNFVELAQGTKAWREPQTGAMVRRPMYNNITFHRVLRGQMIQSGDPTGSSAHNCGVTVPDEPQLGLQFDRSGRLAVANSGTPNSVPVLHHRRFGSELEPAIYDFRPGCVGDGGGGRYQPCASARR
jgi:hypothetical protein